MTITYTESSEPTANMGSNNTITIIAAVVSTVSVLLIISILVILILIAVAYKRNKFGGHDASLANYAYSDITPSGKEEKESESKYICDLNHQSEGM